MSSTNTSNTKPILSPPKTHLLIPTPSTLKCHSLLTSTTTSSRPNLQCTLRCRTSHPPTFLSTNLIATILSNDQIQIHDLNRGVTIETLSTSPHRPHAITASPSHFYILATEPKQLKVYALEYDLNSYTLVRKIKCGKCHSDSNDSQTTTIRGVVSSCGAYLALCKGSSECRVIRLNDGSKEKFELEESSCVLGVYWEDRYVLMESEESLKVYEVKNEMTLEYRRDVETSGDLRRVEVLNDVLLVCSDRSIRLHRLTEEEEDAIAEFRVPNESDGSPPLTVATAHFQDNDKLKVYWYYDDNPSDLMQFTVSYKTIEGTFRSSESLGAFLGEDAKTSAKKRSADDSSDEKRKRVEILGPGGGGAEQVNVTEFDPNKQRRQTTDETVQDAKDEEMKENLREETIADRLRAIQTSLHSDDDESTKPITTETLTTLLTQALQSNDDTALHTVLTQPKPTLSNLTNTLHQIPEELKLRLLQKLILQLGTQPKKNTTSTLIWIRAAVKSLEHSKELNGVLIPLRNLIQERVEVMRHLLLLEGRLEMLVGGGGGEE